MMRRMSAAIDKASGCPIRIRHLDDVIENDVTDKRRQDLERPLRYSNLDKPQLEKVTKLLNGGISLDHVPRLRPKTVRMFVCSSGHDFDAERNYLHEHVYPLVRQYCRETHGIDFQLSDMYWGNPGMPCTDPEKMDVLYDELKHCQDVSMGPNFVSFIGQKYGPTRLQSTIPSNELDEIKAVLQESGRDISLLDELYKQDYNTKPNVYRLEVHQAHIGRKSSESQREAIGLLEDGATKCLITGRLSSACAAKFISSDLELLHHKGLLDLDEEQRNSKCIVYMRDINNIEQHLSAKNSKTFVDLTKHTRDWDPIKREKIKVLKSNIEDGLAGANVHKSTIHLNGCTLDESKSEEYTKNIARHFYSTVTSLIDEEVHKMDSICEDKLCKQVIGSWNHIKQYSTDFAGREDVLNSIKVYLLSETDQPMIIHGGTGSGKSTTLAKAASDINEAIENSDLSMPTSLIARFIGQNGGSEDIQQLLFYLCHQLAFVTGRYRQDVPSSYQNLKNYFIDLIQRGEYGGMLVILIDGLEKISPIDGGHKLDWLPSRLAANIKIVATVNSESHEVFERIQNKFSEGILQIPTFSSTDCENIMKLLMNDIDCSVNYNQWKGIQNAFKACTSPLFVRLVFEQATGWKSYNEKITYAGSSVEGIIERLFDQLEAKFGNELITNVLGYITTAKKGLSESELEDILSLDENVLNYVFSHIGGYPTLRRFPPHCWIAIRKLLSPYLAQKAVDNIGVVQWKYKIFADIARDRYASIDGDCSSLHTTISDYYLGVWSGIKQKPFRHPAVLMAKYKLIDGEDEECRNVPEQPFNFGQSGSYNMRKLSQLPFSLSCCYRCEELKSQVLCNYDYIYNKLKISSVQSLLSDYKMYSDKETSLVADSLEMSKSALEINPDALGLELTGRLLPHIHKYPHIKAMIRQCDLDCQRSCPLIPNCQIYTTPGGPLQYECDIADGIKCDVDMEVFSSPDGVLLTAKPHHSQKLQVWELSQGDERPDIMLPVGDVYPSRDGKFINIIVDNSYVRTFRSDCGVLYGEVYFGQGKIADIDVGSKYVMFSIYKGAGPCIIDTERSEILHKFAYHTHAVAISGEESFVAFNSERSILLYELPVIKRRCVAQVTDIASDIIFVDETPKCYIQTQSKLIEAVQFDVINRKYFTKTVLTDLDSRECIPSNQKGQMLVRCGKTLHLIDTVKDVVKARFKKLPPGVFVDSSSTFSGAGFSPDDSMVLATRYTYLIVWDSDSCETLRVLQSMVSPMVKLFTCSTINKVVTLLENNVFQVWNLDNLDRDVQHSAEVHDHPVKSLVVSSSARCILSHDSQIADAKVINLDDGKVVDNLQHSDNAEDKIVDVKLSPDGQYAVTRAKLVPTPRSAATTSFEPITDDIMWEIETASKVFHAMSNRYIVFSPSSKTAAFVTCAFYNPHDWSENMYNVFIVNPETSSNYALDFPYSTEFVGEPCIARKNKEDAFVAVIQTCKKTLDDRSKKEIARWSEVALFVQKLSENEMPEDQVTLRLHNIVDAVNENDELLAVNGLPDGNILIVYANDVDPYTFATDKGIVKPQSIPKGAVVFDANARAALKHMPCFLNPSSDVYSLRFSTSSSVIVDQKLNALKLETSRHVGGADCTKMRPESAKLALDGKYMIGISKDQLRILVYRVSDAKELGYVFVHGRATCLDIAEDDRTVVVGCHDGRVMILSLILEFCDPVREYIEKLPSRCREDDEDNLISTDVNHISRSTPDQQRLSARMRKVSLDQERLPPPYTTLYRAVTVSRQSSRSRAGSACAQQ